MAKNTEKQKLCIILDQTLVKDLKAYAYITNRPISFVIAESLFQRLYPLKNEKSGKIEAFYGECRNESGEPQMCYVLNETTISGKPYYLIYMDGTFTKVPAEEVQVYRDRPVPLPETEES